MRRGRRASAMGLHKRDAEILERFRTLLQTRGVRVKRVIVYGSRARGDNDPDSDLDVLVEVAEADSAVRRAVLDCAWEAGYDDCVVVAPTLFTTEEIERGPESESVFVQSVLREGVAV